MSEAMPDLPVPPLSSVISRSGGEDALQITFRSSWPPDSMASYYRNILSSGAWRLVSDTRNQDGTISLYAEREGPPLWVTIQKDSTSRGSLLSLGGAVVKPTPTPPAAPPDTTTPS
jgi:hypothetical protein